MLTALRGKMRPLRRLLPSPSVSLALIAVVLSATGLAVAAIPDSKGVIHACYAKSDGALRVVSGKTCAAGEKKLAWNRQGRQGNRGPRGLKGDHGQPGQPGQTGSPGASALIGRINSIPANLAGVKFGAPNGTSTASDSSDAVDELAPNAAFTAKDLHAHFQASSTGDDQNATLQVALEDETHGIALVCTVTSGSDCNSGSATLSVQAGDKLAVVVESVNGTTPPAVGTDVLFGWRATTP